jgi:TonB family protein
MGRPVRAAAQSENQSDLLLWVAGGVIAAVGIAWLLVMKPWYSGEAPANDPAELARATGASSEVVVAIGEELPVDDGDADVADGGETAGLDNPLRMAQLAYEAGMLVEPEEYSAWTLFARVVKTEPTNEAALEGLNKVADDLVRRGETALDQGRLKDARATAERILAALPVHAGAKALAEKVRPEPPPAEVSPSTRTPPVEPSRVERAAIPPPRPAVDPVQVAGAAFDEAMAAGRLLTPIDESAKHYLGELVSLDPESERTQTARATLEKELLSRSSQSIEALDSEAAEIWIEEAEAINFDHGAVQRARSALTEHLIQQESAKRLPASELTVVSYVPPEYPDRALTRGMAGWVDVEFTVGTDGATHDVTVVEASNEMFSREAVAAVSQWQFEPRVFMSRTIEQRSYTRIRFVL